MSPERNAAGVVCPEHLRFVPCRRCKGPIKLKTDDPFIVEIARRYQAGELAFTLDVDIPVPAGVPSNAELAERAKDLDAYTVVRGWLRQHAMAPPSWSSGRPEWLDWAARNFLADPEVAQHLAPRAGTEAETVEAICAFLRREAMDTNVWVISEALARVTGEVLEGAWRPRPEPAQSNPDLWQE